MKNNAIAKRDNLNSQIMAIQDVEQVINEYEEKKAKYEDAKIMYDQTKTLNENVSKFITALEDNQPKGLTVSEFESEEESVAIKGYADKYDSVAKLIVQLKQVDCVDNIFVDKIEEAENDNGVISYEFEFRCNFVSDEEEEPEDELEGASLELQAE